MAIGEIVAGAVQGVANAGWNIGSQLYQWKREDRANALTRQREDTAVQRRVADLKAAGLSPVLAAGSSANTSQPIMSSPNQVHDNTGMDIMSMLQGKANIANTNAGTELSKIQATSELFKQAFINQQTQNLRSEQTGIDLRNSWINADMSSTLGLRSAQKQKLGAELGQISANTALLQAKTAYEQASTDYMKTHADNEKIFRDINLIDLDWREANHFADNWNKFTSGNILKTLTGGVLSGSTYLEKAFPSLHLGAGSPRPSSKYNFEP